MSDNVIVELAPTRSSRTSRPIYVESHRYWEVPDDPETPASQEAQSQNEVIKEGKKNFAEVTILVQPKVTLSPTIVKLKMFSCAGKRKEVLSVIYLHFQIRCHPQLELLNLIHTSKLN